MNLRTAKALREVLKSREKNMVKTSGELDLCSWHLFQTVFTAVIQTIWDLLQISLLSLTMILMRNLTGKLWGVN